MEERIPPPRAVDEHGRRRARHFLDAAAEGHLRPLLDMLVEDVVFVADGSARPILGSGRVRRGFVGVARKRPAERVARAEYNGAPALVTYRVGRPEMVMVVELDAGGAITDVFLHRNPDRVRTLAVPR